MNGGAPTCPACGGLNTNPQSFQCSFCGSVLPQAGYAQPAPQMGYGAPPPGYPQQQQQPQMQQQPPWPGYGPPPPGYGQQAPMGQMGYGAPPPGYGVQPGFGANPYAQQPPNPYAQQNPYGGVIQQQYPGQYPVQGFGGVQPFMGDGGFVQRSGWASGWSTFFWIRLGIAAVVISLSLMGACVNAITH